MGERSEGDTMVCFCLYVNFNTRIGLTVWVSG